jgi:hypothetical protein
LRWVAAVRAELVELRRLKILVDCHSVIEHEALALKVTFWVLL